MLNNHFANSPTVGSQDQATLIDELQDRVNVLEQRLSGKNEEPAPKEKQGSAKRIWKKFKEFFKDFIIPVLKILPPLISAVARLKVAMTPMGHHTARAY